MIVPVQVAGGCFSRRESLQGRAIHKENIGPAVVVIIKDSDTSAGGFNDVLLGFFAPKNVHHREPGLFSDVGKIGDLRRTVAWLSICARST